MNHVMKAEYKNYLIAALIVIATIYIVVHWGGRDLCDMLGLRYKGRACSQYTNQADCEAAGCTWADGVCKRD